MIAGDASRDASSTRISSKSRKSWARTDAMASASQRAPLCTGMTIETRGGGVESRASVPISHRPTRDERCFQRALPKLLTYGGSAQANFALHLGRHERHWEQC